MLMRVGSGNLCRLQAFVCSACRVLDGQSSDLASDGQDSYLR